MCLMKLTIVRTLDGRANRARVLGQVVPAKVMEGVSGSTLAVSEGKLPDLQTKMVLINEIFSR